MTTNDLTAINQAQKLIQDNEESLRQCDVCNRYMVAGYLHQDKYYDTDKCLFSIVSEANWNSINHEESEESYWTEWGELVETKHIHNFKSEIAFDWQGNSYEFGKCECGEKDM